MPSVIAITGKEVPSSGGDAKGVLVIKLEKIYFRVSIVMCLAALSLFLPNPYVGYIWGNYGHFAPVLVTFFFGTSLILGVLGFVLIFIAAKKKRKIYSLLLATIFSISFMIISSYLFKIHHYFGLCVECW